MMRSGLMNQLFKNLAAGVAVASGVAVLSGCNPDYTINLYNGAIKEIKFVSATPAKIEDGSFVRQCGGEFGTDIDSLALSFVLVGSDVSADGAEVANPDMDKGVRPGDYVRTKVGENDKGEAIWDRFYLKLDEEGVVADSSTRLVSASDFDVKVNCLDPHPLSAYSSGCTIPQGVSGAPDALGYSSYLTAILNDGDTDNDAQYPRPDQNGQYVSVAVLFDQSGSMTGYVEPESMKEFSPEAKTTGNTTPSVVYAGKLASDFQGFRVTAAQSLLELANPGDRYGFFQFGEKVGANGAKVLCASDSGSDTSGDTSVTEEARRLDCFGINRDIKTSSVFRDLQNSAKGRTPTWGAVKDVYEWMKENEVYAKNSRPISARHILVFTDGPDTCAASSPDYEPYLKTYRKAVTTAQYEKLLQNYSCSDVSGQDFVDFLKNDVLKNGSLVGVSDVPVHISFIQIQSRGYPEPDPFQQEVACLTGGHYFFINSNSLPSTAPGAGVEGEHPLLTALKDDVLRFRYAISGVWQAAVKVPDLSTIFATSNRIGSGGRDEDLVARAASETCTDPDVSGFGVIAGASISLQGSINGISNGDGTSPLDSTKVTGDEMSMSASDIDRRGSFHLPSAPTATAECVQWMPLCSIAADSEAPFSDGNTVAWKAVLNHDCVVTTFDSATDVCRVEYEVDSTPCGDGTGKCCWGGCVEPNDNQCKEDTLDEVCNYPNKQTGTSCTSGTDTGCCKQGNCLTVPSNGCKVLDMSCAQKNKDNGTACKMGAAADGQDGVCLDGDCVSA